MAKTSFSSEKWLLVKAAENESRYGGYIYQATLISENLQIAHTYIDPNNKNYRRWEPIIHKSHKGQVVVLKGIGLKDEYFRRTDEMIINADSPIIMVDDTLTMADVAEWVEEQLAPSNVIEQIFERR